MSVVTLGELRYGAERSSERDRMLQLLKGLLELIPAAPMSPDVAAHYGAIRGDLARRGELIGPNDLWIAAHALSLGLTLVTANRREHTRVAGLAVEDWASE
jgi:tRNA(fMet)-specific endonuclease VapC